MGPIRKWQQGFLSSKYNLDDIKTICQDYTEKYDKIEFFIFTNGLLYLAYSLSVIYPTSQCHSIRCSSLSPQSMFDEIPQMDVYT